MEKDYNRMPSKEDAESSNPYLEEYLKKPSPERFHRIPDPLPKKTGFLGKCLLGAAGFIEYVVLNRRSFP